jgi:flagellar M-ring protein FliF
MAGDAAQGIPGALSNQPPGTAGTPPAAQQAAAGAATTQQPVSSSNRTTRNFEVDRTISYTRGQGGMLRKLSVAVVVDNWQRVDDSGEPTSTPLTPEEVERMTTLVKEAIGFNETRGDRVNVMNTPFHTEPPLPEAEAPGLLDQPWVKSVLKQGVAVVLVLLLAFVVLKPIMASLTQPARGGTATLSPDQLMLGGAPGMYAGNYDQQVAAARGMVGQDPKRAAAVMKEWVNG